MRDVDGRLILIDLDASVPLGKQAGAKHSSAYMPPEMTERAHKRINSGGAGSHMAGSSFAYLSAGPVGPAGPADTSPPKGGELPPVVVKKDGVVAHQSYDIWSLGIILYQMCTGEQMFLSSYDSLAESDLEVLHEWSDVFTRQKMQKITQSLPRNLVSRILTKDPAKRPSLSAILAHPFLSGRPIVRLVGEAAMFDVFISYRKDTDSEHARYLRELLMAKGWRVWLDQNELPHAGTWESEMVNGIAKSKVFVTLISDGSLVKLRNLSPHSDVDNYFLEMQLALELKTMGLIDTVFPVFVGERVGEAVGHSLHRTYSPFNFGCLENLPDIVVRYVKSLYTGS
jgi:serine/threonine protein kinase